MDSSDPNTPYLATAAQIKLLMAAPEKIWSSVENGKDYLSACQMYLFARHVHTCLTLEQRNSSGENAAVDHLAWFPVVGRQWAAIAHFYDAILQVRNNYCFSL